MATALQRQLAAVAANSTHQLDLKAQKSRHSESLLFERQEASRQSFDEIYQLCYEGFEELCELDSRFVRFGASLFSPESRSVEREQLTAHENRELDELLGTFLGLLQGRLLLRPAQKSVEWLVRRYRVHEYNAEALLLTFLPHHAHQHIFPTLLSLLAKDRKLPEAFKWLFPYTSSLSPPPRHALLTALTSNKSFFSSLNAYVMRVAKHGHASGILLAFWASITAQAVNAMFDASQSGRENVRRQREEDLLLRILPVLQEALSLSKGSKTSIPELYIGACTIVTILVTKATLEDNVLDAIMEAVIGACNVEQTLEEGVTCLAVVASEKREVSIPPSVTRTIVRSSDDTLKVLLQLGRTQYGAKFAAGLGISVVRLSCKTEDITILSTVKKILEAGTLSDQHTALLLSELLSSLTSFKEGTNVNTAISAMLNGFAQTASLDENRNKRLLEQAAHASKVDVRMLDLVPSHDLEEEEPEAGVSDTMAVDTESRDTEADFRSLLDALPPVPDERFSFLATDSDELVFQAYSRAFRASLSSKTRMKDFQNLTPFRRCKLPGLPEYLPFLARLWSSNAAYSLSASKMVIEAIVTANVELENLVGHQNEFRGLDLSLLLPYVISAMGTESRTVRKAASALCQTMGRLFRAKKVARPDSDILKDEGISEALHDADLLLTAGILPVLEDCVLDAGYVVKAMSEILNGASKTSDKDSHAGKGIKKQVRSDLCSYLAAHVSSTPVLRVKLTLLRIISEVKNAAQGARQKFLVSFARAWATRSYEEVMAACLAEELEVKEIDNAVLECLTHRSDEELEVLRDFCLGSSGAREGFQAAAFNRLRHLWKSMKEPEQVRFMNSLVELALGGAGEKAQELALETLRNLRFSTEVLVHILGTLPSLATLRGPDQPPAAKKRRTSRSETERPLVTVDQNRLQAAVKKITLVLELVEGSKVEHHPGLLRPLFLLLTELRQYKTVTGSELPYLHAMVLDALLSVVEGAVRSTTGDIDTEVVRADLIVEIVRTTSSTQVHNTALRLLSSLASWKSDIVLHSVMPLFTFMSSAIFRNNDEYSIHVTDQVVSLIVPALVTSLKTSHAGKSNLLGSVSELLLSFTAAWEHVPLHRRLGLFVLLVDSIGEEECLGAVTAMLFERYGTSHEEELRGFVRELFGNFASVTSLSGAQQRLDMGFEGLSRPTAGGKKSAMGLCDTLLGFGDKSQDERHETVEMMLDGLAVLVADEGLKKKMATTLIKNAGTGDRIRVLYANVLGRCMQLTAQFPNMPSANAVLSSVLGLMPTKDFIASSAQLMQTGSDETRQQVFRSLESRAGSASRTNIEERDVFVNVLPNCVAFLRLDQSPATRLASIGCIDAICERFGKAARVAVLRTAEVVSGPAALGSSDGEELPTMSLLCLASMIEVLEEECVQILPGLLRWTLDYLTGHGSSRLHGAAFSLLTAVVDHLPWMLSGEDLNRAFRAAAGSEADVVGEFGSLAARKIPASEFFTALNTTWLNVLRDIGAEGMRWLLENLRRAIQHHTKATIAKNTSTIFILILEAFDLRRHLRLQNGDAEDLAELYDLVDKLALDTTLKLNDNTFRPFFIRAVEWATTSIQRTDIEGRELLMTSLFSFSLALFRQLKGLVTSYAGILLESAVDVLQSHQQVATSQAHLLIDLVLKTLSSSFQNDDDGFWTAPGHFDAIYLPVINRLQHATNGISGTAEISIETVTDLAASVIASPDHLKSMNAALLSLLRDQDATVRLTAVKSQRRVIERLGLDWLALLPEMLPIISELQEDDNEDVERETLRWVKQIEDVTGESLEGMLA